MVDQSASRETIKYTTVSLCRRGGTTTDRKLLIKMGLRVFRQRKFRFEPMDFQQWEGDIGGARRRLELPLT